jgi:diguanylate cyclase (GGDEF)-like protein/PAS domain S-box-containing protein
LEEHLRVSLVTRIFALIAFTLLLVAGGELFNGMNLRQNRLEEVSSETVQLARIAELDMVRILEGTHQLLATLAKLPTDRGWDERACSVVEATASSDFEYDHIVATDRSGTVQCSSSGASRIGTQMGDPELLDRVVSTAGFSVGTYGRGLLSGNEVIRVGYPVVDDAGTVIGAVSAGINVTWLNTAISQWNLGATASIEITDRNGIVIARHPDPRGVGQPIAGSLKSFLHAEAAGTAGVEGADGVVRLYGYVPVNVGPSDGLAVFVGRDQVRIFADIHRSIWLNVAVVLIGLLLSAVFALIYVRRVLGRPFRRLLSVVGRWRDGDWSVRTGAASGIPEFDRLSLAFDRMAGEVSARDRSLQIANTLLETTKDMSPDAILVVDADRRIISFNRQFVEMWRLPPGLIEAGKDVAAMAAVASLARDPEAFVARVQYLYEHPEDSAQEELETTDGRFLDRHTTALHTADGRYLGRAWFFRDVTERKRTEEKISRMARYDTLTGLANRGVFVEALQHEIAGARRGAKSFAVLYLDLDHFKDVNDTLGHPIGDLLLKSVAERLQGSMRETDIVARFGGDEFAMIGTDILEPADAANLADRVLKAMRTPFSIQGNEIRIGTSVGIAVYGPESAEAEALLSHADVALYRAKSEGRGTYRFFTDAMDTEVRTRVTLEAELRTAIAAGQFFLVYQPQVDVDTGRIVGVEALVRWRHPTRGIVLPGRFIPVAEKSGLIVALGLWVMREACRQMKEWLDAGIAPPLIAVNLSAVQFKTPLELENDIAAILAETALPARFIELELTESVLMEASLKHNDVLLRLRKAGLRIAIDDFGTGYSSLDYLRRFPVDRIKIAQHFIVDLTTASSDAAIVRAAIGLAHELNLKVVVEGVETAEQLKLVRSWGCHQVQGYYFSKPIRAEDITARLRKGTIVPVRRAVMVEAAIGQ